MLMRNRISSLAGLDGPVAPSAGTLPLPSGAPVRWLDMIDALLEIRWDKVRMLRSAIAHGRYDLDARLDDLLNDPPEELTLLARS